MPEELSHQNQPPKPEGSILSSALYGASLPERALRGMVGAVSGVLKESAEAVLPDALRGTKLYQLTLQKTLRILVEDIGGLRAPVPAASGTEPPFAAPGEGAEGKAPAGDKSRGVRLAVANAVDLAGLTTLHLSPLWIFALSSDLAHGARTYLKALVEELKAKGVLRQSETIENVDELLGSLQRLSGSVADKLDAPPLTLRELKRSVDELKEKSKSVDLAKLIPAEEIDRAWKEIQSTALREGCSIFEVSSAISMLTFEGLTRAGKGAYGSLKVGFDLFEDNVLQYYLKALARIREKGYYQALAEAYEPYLKGLRHLFEPKTETLTQRLLTGKLFRALWRKLRSWFRRAPRLARP
jgi:hypothetical protein